MNYRCISADSHLEVKPERYTCRVPSQYRDRMPKTITIQNGIQAVLQEGRPLSWLLSNISCGLPYQQRRPFDPSPEVDYDASPGTGSPAQRLQEQAEDGVDAEVLFPGNVGPHYWRGIRNDDAFKAVVRAYNDWLAEEYCSYAPDRLIGVGVIPMTGVTDACTELEHCAKVGLKAICLGAFPSSQRAPSVEDDKFWAAVCETEMLVTIHVQFGFPPHGTAASTGPIFKYPKKPAPDVPVPEMIERFNKFGFRGSIHISQLIWAGVFDRFPKLKIYLAEVQVGWIPNWLEQLDDQYLRHGYWTERLLGLSRLRRLPSEYVREHCWWGFLRSPVGVRVARSELGVDRLLWASDFPHLESDWPRSREIIEENFAGIPEGEKYSMIAGNAVRLFKLNG